MADVVTYGWDASHYDGSLNRTILARAKSEGIQFFSHKIGEGLSNTDTTQASALAGARDAGIRVIGGYYYIHSGSMVTQAKRCIALADRYEPWWRQFNGWFWQTDAETSSTGLPSPSEVKLFSDTLTKLTGRLCVVYASAGMYGNRLSGLGHPLWNANYGSNAHGGFKSLYPGNGFRGWNSYSGHTPLLLQYGSNATIAGLTTCDANAFRGTIDQLYTYITMSSTDPRGVPVAHDPLSGADLTNVAYFVAHNSQYSPAPGATDERVSLANAVETARNAALALVPSIAALTAKVDALTAAVAALSNQSGAGGAAVLAAINAVAAQESSAVTTLQAQNAALHADLDEALSPAPTGVRPALMPIPREANEDATVDMP